MNNCICDESIDPEVPFSDSIMRIIGFVILIALLIIEPVLLFLVLLLIYMFTKIFQVLFTTKSELPQPQQPQDNTNSVVVEQPAISIVVEQPAISIVEKQHAISIV